MSASEGLAPTAAARPLPVLVLGDANVDLVLRGDVVPRFGQVEQLADSGDLVLGGSASIAASGIARLGVSTSLVARVGADAFGAFALDALRRSGVDVDLVEVSPEEETGLSVILSTPDDRAILTVPGTIPTLSDARVIDILGAWPTAPGVVHTGSFFLQPRIAAGLASVYAFAQSRGWTTSLDTNWDPSERWEGVADVLGYLDILLPNRNELRAMAVALGDPAGSDDVELGVRLARRGPRVVVKDGAAGGWSVGADGHVVRASGLAVDVVDTTGAGDSFDAGYLAAVAHGVADEHERVRWATHAGSLSTLGAGGTGSQARLGELRAALTR